MTKEITAKKLIRYGSALLLFLVVAGYAIWQSRDLLFGITVSVNGIQNGMTVTDPLLALSGTSPHARGMTIDGQDVPTAENGTWTDTIALMPGVNTITIAATDKFHRTISKQYVVYYKN